MRRYCKQRDRYSCGPIALINIAKHFGRPATYKDLPKFQKLLRCTNPNGTFSRDITRVLGRAARRKWAKAKEFVLAGNCILVQTKRSDGHYYVMLTNGNGDIGIVNYYRNWPTATKITPQCGARLLRTAFRTWYVTRDTP